MSGKSTMGKVTGFKDDVNMVNIYDNDKIVKTFKEVIFCGDCIYGEKYWCDIWQHSVVPGDFCSKAKKEE